MGSQWPMATPSWKAGGRVLALRTSTMCFPRHCTASTAYLGQNPSQRGCWPTHPGRSWHGASAT